MIFFLFFKHFPKVLKLSNRSKFSLIFFQNKSLNILETNLKYYREKQVSNTEYIKPRLICDNNEFPKLEEFLMSVHFLLIIKKQTKQKKKKNHENRK